MLQLIDNKQKAYHRWLNKKKEEDRKIIIQKCPVIQTCLKERILEEMYVLPFIFNYVSNSQLQHGQFVNDRGKMSKTNQISWFIVISGQITSIMKLHFNFQIFRQNWGRQKAFVLINNTNSCFKYIPYTSLI